MADITRNPALLSTSQGQRRLPVTTFAASSQLRIQVPCDTVIRSMRIRFSGYITTTYASGTPVADSLSTVDNLVPNVRLLVDGATTIKSVRPYLQQQLQLLVSGNLAERKASAGASAASFNNPTADGGFTYGTTGQITTVAESFDLFFYVPFADKKDQNATLLNLKGRSTCDLYLSTAAYSSLLGFGNTAPVVYSADTFQVDVVIIEDRSMPKEQEFLDYIQNSQSNSYSAAANGLRIRLPVSQFLMGLSILTRDGFSGTTTTATGKVLNSNVISNISLQINGQTTIKQTTFQQLQAENKAQFGVNAAYASNVSRFDGFAFLNLLQDGKLSSALNCRRQDGVDNVELVIDLAAVSYTNPVEVVIETHEWRQRL